ncbi:MAG: FAD-dependent monooxygenase [Candidatus Lambdaproteobacteria bacterium]|nr:FAD-dependent monooxygenase [Candidatus Lambdaproteobacteria bacterium]
MEREAEVLIVGGGPAGLALALRLGRAGRRTLLVERAPLPRDKVCGEGLMPMGCAALAALGVEPAQLPGHDFHGIEYRGRHRRVALDFPQGAAGRGIRRTVLLAALHARLAGLPAVTQLRDIIVAPLVEGGRVVGARGLRGVYRAAVVAAADGVHSRLAAALGPPLGPLPIARGVRYGVRQHFELGGRPPGERVRVGLFAPHHVYLTPTGPGELLATTMTDAAGFRALRGDYLGFLRATPYGALFEAARPASRRLGWVHPLFEARDHAPGGALLLGDAGGGADPCLGLGISLALLTSARAFASMSAMLEQPLARLDEERAFHEHRRRLFRHYGRFDTVFRRLISTRSGGEILLWALQHWPDTAQQLLRIVGERQPWRTLSWCALAMPWMRWRPPAASRAAGGKQHGRA